MSRAILQQASLGRAALRVGSRGSPGGTAAADLVGRATRRFAVTSTQGLHHEPVGSSSYWQHQQAWYGGLAVAVAGSVSVLAVLQLKSVEELFPSLVKEATSSPKRIEDLYTFKSEESLGRGQFGTVSTATDKATGEVVAVKRVPRSKTSEKNFREEAELHREVGSHPNVVGLKGVFADDECWYVVMELARGGELFDRLTTEGVVLETDEIRCLLRETAGAMAYLHDRGIVHGDIKPENVLLTNPAATKTPMPTATASTVTAAARASDELVGGASSKGVSRFAQAGGGGSGSGENSTREGSSSSGLGKVLLADFGSSFRLRGVSANGGKLVKEYTVAYSAPEVVENSPHVDNKIDVWSLGVIAYVMVKGHHPFDPSSEADDDEIAESIINSEPDWDGVDSQAAQLIRRMLARDPVDRPSAEEVLRSSWLCAPSAKQGHHRH